jgi:hypothetical protein
VSAGATFLCNYVAYQLGWLAAIVGAAWGRHRRAEVGLVLVAFITGVAVESWQIASGTYRLLDAGPVAGVPPPWLLALWAQFATTFRFSLRRVMTRPWSAMLFGAVGGPVAFLAGERLGAVELAVPLWPALARLVVAWALALGWLAWLTRRLPGDDVPAYRAVRRS